MILDINDIYDETKAKKQDLDKADNVMRETLEKVFDIEISDAKWIRFNAIFTDEMTKLNL